MNCIFYIDNYIYLISSSIGDYYRLKMAISIEPFKPRYLLLHGVNYKLT